ncbi:MAG: quinolinate synthase NadA, partial [Lentisphaerales bacterium]|nr:quinolinate synthase NadA [Lentisphaerales bacterium]
PDKLMGLNIIDEMKRRQVNKEIKVWHGSCYVHEEYDPEMIEYLRSKESKLQVLAHPECSPQVLNEADFTGSTSQLIKRVKESTDEKYLLLTECGLTTRLQLENPAIKFIGSCSICKYMKSNTLEGILRVLEEPTTEDFISIPASIQQQAKECIEKMFEWSSHSKPSAMQV